VRLIQIQFISHQTYLFYQLYLFEIVNLQNSYNDGISKRKLLNIHCNQNYKSNPNNERFEKAKNSEVVYVYTCPYAENVYTCPYAENV
jgi:hypothetical protein